MSNVLDSGSSDRTRWMAHAYLEDGIVSVKSKYEDF
jgi:hypothetical protein